ncbi:MAG: YihY/virulence factor BrkB family protein [Gemmatimonadaceae bacterium]
MNAPPPWGAARLRDTLADYARRIWDKGGEDDLFFLAGGVAYSILLAGVPFFLLLIAGAGFALNKTQADSTRAVVEFLGRLLPVGAGDNSTFLDPILRDVVRTSGRVGLVSAAAFVWFSTRLFGTLRSVLVRVFELGQGRGIVVGKVYDVGYTLVSSVLVVAYLTLSAYMAMMRGQGLEMLRQFGLSVSVMGSLEYAIGRVLSFAVVVAIFFLLYKFLPGGKVRATQAVVASMTTGVLFEIARNIFVLVIRQFNPASLYTGSLGALVIVVFWVYYSALLFVVGGEVAHVYDDRRRLIRRAMSMEG